MIGPMKKIRWFFPIFICALVTHAQTKSNNSLSLQDIQLSNAPAFSLLDISPASIQKPASTKAFTTSVLSNLGNGIPQNYALEVTPFWLRKHVDLTTAKYIGFTDDPKVPANKGYDIWNKIRYSQFSFAIANRDSSTNVGSLANHNVSLGARVTLVSVYKQSDLNNIRSKTSQWLNALQDAQGNGPNPRGGNAIEKATQSAADAVAQALKTVPIFSLDLAAASNMAFDSNSTTSNRLNRTGIWVDLNFAFPLNKSRSNYLNICGLGRYIYDRDSMNPKGQYINSNFWDYGFQVQLVIQNFSAAYEYIGRKVRWHYKTQIPSKSVGIIQYKG